MADNCKLVSFFEKNVPFIVLFVAVVVFLDAVLGHRIDFLETDESIHTLHDAGLVFLTAILVWVAWYQLRGISKTSRGDFLIRIDERYSSDEILEGRIILERMRREVAAKLKEGISKEEERESIIKGIGEKIRNMYSDRKKGKGHSNEKKYNEEVKKFVFLINLLNFLETVSYFCNNRFIYREEVSELMEHSFIWYHDVFSEFIDRYRQDEGSDKYCAELKTMLKR